MNALFILFIAQIIFESFPVSSSGHIRLLRHWISVSLPEKMLGYVDDVANGFTAFILAIIFFRKWWMLLCSLVGRRVRKAWRFFLKIIGLTFVACVTTTAWYGLIRVLLRDAWLLQQYEMLLVGFMITTALLLSLLWLPKNNSVEPWSLKKAFILGFVQGVALLPGISRFASTYVVGRWLKLSARRAFEISFLIEFPLITAALIHGIAKIPREIFSELFAGGEHIFITGVAIFLGYVGLWVAQRMALRGTFWKFGIYMLVPLGVVLWILS